jgi:hypothetical protein
MLSEVNGVDSEASTRRWFIFTLIYTITLQRRKIDLKRSICAVIRHEAVDLGVWRRPEPRVGEPRCRTASVLARRSDHRSIVRPMRLLNFARQPAASVSPRHCGGRMRLPPYTLCDGRPPLGVNVTPHSPDPLPFRLSGCRGQHARAEEDGVAVRWWRSPGQHRAWSVGATVATYTQSCASGPALDPEAWRIAPDPRGGIPSRATPSRSFARGHRRSGGVI